MRRIYIQKKKQRPVVEDALRQMRETQEALGPEFMTRLKLLVKDFDPESMQRMFPPDEENLDAPVAASDTDFEPIDRKKSLLIVMKFLQMKQENKGIQTKVRTLLSETTTIQ